MRRFYGYVVVWAFILSIVLIAAIGIPVKVTPELSKVSYNASLPADWVGKDEDLSANFSGHFFVSVHRFFGKIIIWVTPGEGARIDYIAVKVRRKFLNELYLEVEPPWYGKVEITHITDGNDMVYLIQLKGLGEDGEGTCEITLVDNAPEDRLSLTITVEARDGPFRYGGKAPGGYSESLLQLHIQGLTLSPRFSSSFIRPSAKRYMAGMESRALS